MRVARWLLTKCIAAERRDAIIGDLEEEYARGRSGGWYWKETAMAIAHEVRRIELADVAWPVGLGLAGATLQILITIAGIHGPGVMFPYPLVVLLTAFYGRRRYPSSFAARFWVLLAAFMCMTVVFYFALYAVVTPWGIVNAPLAHHLFVLTMMLAIGCGTAAAVASLSRISQVGPVAFSIALAASGTGALFILGYAGTVGDLTTCAAILLTSAVYIYFKRISGFPKRYAIACGSFASAFILTIAIHALNHRIFAVMLPQLGVVLGAGCAAAALIARFTPVRSKAAALPPHS
jgi:hypothetical protein